MMTDEPVTDCQLELVGSALSRVLQTLGPEVLRGGAVPAWDTVLLTILQQQSAGLIAAEDASEELTALQSLAAAAGQPGLQSRLDGIFFARPLVRQVLAEAVSQPDRDLPDRLARLRKAALAEPSAAGAASALAGDVRGKQVHEPISKEDLRTLVHHLAGGWDSLDAIFYPDLDHLPSLATAVIAEASWGTGVRPVEWLGANLTVELDGRRNDVHRVYQAALQRDPPPDEEANRPGFLAHSRRLLEGILESGPVWLEVRSAKGQWLRRHGLPAVRSIGLSRAGTVMKTSVFCATAVVRRIGRSAWPAWQKRLNRRLKKAARRLLPHRRQELKLYSFRHDFIDRCKAVLSPAETAALAGHSSAKTKVHYGRPRLRGSTGTGVPAQGLPEEVAAMDLHFERRAAREIDRPGREVASEPEDGEGPSPSPSLSPGGLI